MLRSASFRASLKKEPLSKQQAAIRRVMRNAPMNLEVSERKHDVTEQSEHPSSWATGSGRKIIDISLELDATKFRMRTYEGFKKDMQFDIEVIKEYPGGLGQIVRGAHMRLHAGTHVDAPSHMVQGGKQIHDLALDLFIGGA